MIQLTEKRLKVGPTTIDNLCKQIAENVDESMVVVLMVTDNMAFLVETEEGESHLPTEKFCRSFFLCFNS